MSHSLETIVAWAKRKWFVYPNSEIYGGLANARDYWPYGSLLKKNIADLWIKHFVTSRDDMALMDTAIIANPQTWIASGHAGNFGDALIDDKQSKQRFRADKLLEWWIEQKLAQDKKDNLTIIVDAVRTLISSTEDYDLQSRTLNKELAKYLASLPNKVIVVTNADGDEYLKIQTLLQGYDFELFSLQNNPPKTEVTYFKQLLKHYHLKPKDAVYFDHLQANLDAAHQTGISGILYTTIETALDYFAKDRQYINLNFKIQKIWDDIISGKKTIETRALNPEEPQKYFGSIKVWTIVSATNINTWGIKYLQVKTIYNFNTLQELYDQGINFVNKILPDFIYHNVEELEEYWVHYMGETYVQKIKQNWLIWFEFDIVDPQNSQVQLLSYLWQQYDVSNLIPESRGIAKMTEVIRTEIPNNPDTGKPAEWTEARQFNLMLQTQLGVIEDVSAKAYLRPETCQSLFTNFKQLCQTTRVRIPFGMAQIGKAFRNEITPGQFLYRTREFEQMEIEYFVENDLEKSKTYFEMWKELSMQFRQEIIKLKSKNLRFREHEKDELSFYSAGTFDVEYLFPWGRGELQGLANRTSYDLTQHQTVSGQDLQ